MELLGIWVGFGVVAATCVWFLAGRSSAGGARRLAEFVAEAQAGKLSSRLKGRRVLAICNPHGGKQTAVPVYQQLLAPMCRALGIEVELKVTERPGHALEIARAAQADLVVCLSGDGMIHEVTAGLVGSDGRMRLPLAVMPCGSSNGIAKSLYGSTDPFEAARALLLGSERRSNLISARPAGKEAPVHFDLMGFSFGVCCEANWLAEKKLRVLNRVPVVGAILKDLILALFLIGGMKQHPVQIELCASPLTGREDSQAGYTDPDEEGNEHRAKLSPGARRSWHRIEDRVVWCEVMNVAWLASDIQMAPGLEPDGGTMDLLISRGHSKWQLAKSFLAAEAGQHVLHPWFERYKLTQMIITPAEAGQSLCMSGEDVFFDDAKSVLVKCHDSAALLFY